MKKTFEFGSGRLRGKVGIIAEGKDSKTLKDLLRQFIHRGDGRGNVVMVRINDEALARMDQLVEADLFGSRSECAAFLIGAGIASQKELFDAPRRPHGGDPQTQRAASPGGDGCAEADA